MLQSLDKDIRCKSISTFNIANAPPQNSFINLNLKKFETIQQNYKSRENKVEFFKGSEELSLNYWRLASLPLLETFVISTLTKA